MEGIIQLCLSVICVFTPIFLLALTGFVYALGVGAVRLPGIARNDARPGKEWTTVPEFAQKISDGVAALISLIGAMFGLVGFLLPWVQVNVGGGSSIGDLGNLNGTLSGIALAFQSFIAGIGLFSTDFEGAQTIGILLILVSMVVSVIPIALLITAALGAGLISVPLGLIKVEIRRLARGLLVMSFLSLCLTCGFFAAIQATVGGVKVGGSESIFGTSISMGVEVSNGFWVTVGGLVLALVGAIITNTLAAALTKWAGNLVILESSIEDKEGDVSDSK